MDAQPKTRQLASNVLAIVLWLISFGLGLQAIYTLTQIIALIRVRLGSSVQEASMSSLGLVFFLALGFLVFLIASTEYHIKRVGRPESWRLFGWTIAVELSLLILYYII